ncbi:structural maintenance of chromosomes protein 6-like protein [Anopheles sinensis]|uniref:Structural maintenance of chromosomes protein 6-like protein n=1 Tax=Anopheles sinensis TaxID=74873 RepID=A0A084VWU9_ANOSI|nr:structural maintenance of chromosomes protein 6-like protein [Anopheles sinensis]
MMMAQMAGSMDNAGGRMRDRSSMVRDRGGIVGDRGSMMGNRGSMMVLDGGVSYRSMGVAGHMDGLSDHFVHWLGDLHSSGFTTDDGVESGVVVGVVVDDAVVAVGVQQRVLAMDLISVARLVLALDVSGVLVMDGVRELVVGRSMVVVVVLMMSIGLQDRGLSDGLDDGGLVLVHSRGGVDGSNVVDRGGSVVLDGGVRRGNGSMVSSRKQTSAGGGDQSGQENELKNGRTRINIFPMFTDMLLLEEH